MFTTEINTSGILETHLEKAIRAHSWTSHFPEDRGKRVISDYNQQLEADILELQTAGIEAEQIESYKNKYINLFSSWLNAKSRCASSFITGGSGFNVRRAEKANRSEHNHYELWQIWREKAKKAITRKAKPVTTYLSELDRYRAELEGMKANQELMKEGNKRIKDAKKSGEDLTQYLTDTFNIVPHMVEWTIKFGFGLQNNLANIKRVEQRIKELEQKETLRGENASAKYSFDGGEFIVNYEADRIQIFFSERPNSAQLAEWKSRGLNTYNWSPSNKCWQRKITLNSLSHIKRMINGRITKL